MKWEKKVKPKEGDWKIVTKFAYVPILVDGWWYWLEPYQKCYMWTKKYVGEGVIYRWLPIS